MRTSLELWSPAVKASGERNRRRVAALFVVLAAVIIAPLAVIDLPLLADYPNHVARMHLLGNFDGQAQLGERYILRFEPIPNIAMDLGVPWLAATMPLEDAARVFLALCLITSLAGPVLLHRVLFNHWAHSSLLAAFFVYHGSLIAGMVNFSLGAGLVPLALAAWIRIVDAHAVSRILIGSLITSVLFFCHLVAVGAFGLMVVGFAFVRAQERWREQGGCRVAASEFGIIGAIGLIPALLFLRLLLGVEGGSDSVGVVYGHATWKLKALLSPLANYHRPLDMATFALLASLALVAWRAGWMTVDRRLAPGLSLLTLAFVLAPKALWTGGVFDQRFAVLLAPMLVAGTSISLPKGKFFRLLPALLALLFLVRIGVLTSTWVDHRSDLAEMRAAVDLMTPGGRVLVIRPDVETGPRLAPRRHRVFHHATQLQSLPAVAAIEKAAFVSTLYAVAGQQPLALKPPFDRLGGRGHVDLPTIDDLALALRPKAAGPPANPQIRTWVEDFDYVVLIYGYGAGIDARLTGLPLEPLLDGDILDFFKVIKG